MEYIDVCLSSYTHNNIYLSCHGRTDLTLGYVSTEGSLKKNVAQR